MYRMQAADGTTKSQLTCYPLRVAKENPIPAALYCIGLIIVIVLLCQPKIPSHTKLILGGSVLGAHLIAAMIKACLPKRLMGVPQKEQPKRIEYFKTTAMDDIVGEKEVRIIPDRVAFISNVWNLKHMKHSIIRGPSTLHPDEREEAILLRVRKDEFNLNVEHYFIHFRFSKGVGWFDHNIPKLTHVNDKRAFLQALIRGKTSHGIMVD